MQRTQDLLNDGKKALDGLSRTNQFFYIFWLLGPFVLLIERTPGDFYISIISIVFLIRTLITREYAWLKFFWVKSAFIFWGICLLSAMLSPEPLYALGEAFIWIRFPLFAMATAFWLAEDRRFLFLLFFSTALALLSMCGILLTELAIEGFKERLSWPYDDLVPGNYLAKVGLPLIVFSTSLSLSMKGPKGLLLGCLCIFVIGMTMMTGERINFLIIACASLLTVLIWEPSWKKRFVFIGLVCLVSVTIFVFSPDILNRFVIEFVDHLPIYKGSQYYGAMAPAWFIFEKFPILGIGPGNFRYLCVDLILPNLGYSCKNHPHNFYLQILSETGFLGFASLIVFVTSMIFHSVRGGRGTRHFLYTTAWIVPFAVFWPIRSSADFFGQWNNIFLWTGLALSLSVSHLQRKNPK